MFVLLLLLLKTKSCIILAVFLFIVLRVSWEASLLGGSLLGNTFINTQLLLEKLLGSLSRCNNGNIVGRRFLCCPCRGYITQATSWNTQSRTT
jgi:hypothetical protein